MIDNVSCDTNGYGTPCFRLEKIKTNGEPYNLYQETSSAYTVSNRKENFFRTVSDFVYRSMFRGQYVPDCDLSITIRKARNSSGDYKIDYELLVCKEQEGEVQK
jgi:hypothetical protein